MFQAGFNLFLSKFIPQQTFHFINSFIFIHLKIQLFDPFQIFIFSFTLN